MNELSYSQKKYLFTIYKLCQSGGEAKIAHIMSKVLLRCDGLRAKYGEFVNMSSNIRIVSVDVNPLSI